MLDPGRWSWELERRPIADLGALGSEYPEVHELVASADGTRIAAPVLKAPDVFGVWVNGALWEGEFEKAWHLEFAPDGRLTALVRIDDAWTLGVDGELWEERWEFAWNPTFSRDGRVIALQVKDDMQYTVAVNGQLWEQRFHSSRGLAVSDDGSAVAALVQVVPLAEGDVFGFMDGTWSVAVNDVPWDRKFINVYGPAFNHDGSRLAAEVRLDICEYTLAENAELWKKRFGCVWEPCYRRGGGLIAPVRSNGAWTIAENGEPIWTSRFMQLWNQRLSPDGRRIAAVAATGFGRWTVVVDDRPWKREFSDLVLPPIFSSDGRRLATGVRDAGRWAVVVDGSPWPGSFDMVWSPVFTPAGDRVLAKVEREGRFAIAVDGAIWSRWFDRLWDPIVSPDGSRVLIRAVEDGHYVREVAPLATAARG
jgi:hypothetical protein